MPARSAPCATVNGSHARRRHAVLPNGDVRLRILNLDNTRIIEVGRRGRGGLRDRHRRQRGRAVRPRHLAHGTGDAPRYSGARAAPGAAASRSSITSRPRPWTLGDLHAPKAPRRSGRPSIRSSSIAPDIPRADPARAERLAFTFGAAPGSIAEAAAVLSPDDPLAKILLDALCVRDNAFWAINKASWPSGDHRNIAAAARRAEGRALLRIRTAPTSRRIPTRSTCTATPSRCCRASRLRRPRHFADTVLLQPKERIEIAFVARPGDWMLHCHVLEHLEYGMMGYLRVAA